MEETFEQEVERTVAALKAGKTILYPTDTIWGVGCDATNNKACLRVYAVKQRPLNKSLQTHNQRSKCKQNGIQGFAVVLFLVSDIQHRSCRQTS